MGNHKMFFPQYHRPRFSTIQFLIFFIIAVIVIAASISASSVLIDNNIVNAIVMGWDQGVVKFNFKVQGKLVASISASSVLIDNNIVNAIVMGWDQGVVKFNFKQAAPNCDTVYGVEIGDTCFSVTQQFNLTTEFFTEINPNLVCDKVFVGQWLCIVGSANECTTLVIQHMFFFYNSLT
ncbi:hypothetical protein TEA_029971 [Camellia sinensis var. sinensis]|uniref:LysM domain-containing protein n=1 Tax=Camellia sinensis var. sinensis TaxID=542762 RepID=A0A4S4CWI3_CAMSN|nr:hypothetical protein TEA_029971 [Camellia sinensis var. sinensis]